jgi:diadenosine tetraphosphate (Ap4A) HIT family hydrolase
MSRHPDPGRRPCWLCREQRFELDRGIRGSSDDPGLHLGDVYIAPDISPLVAGHLLLVADTHYPSFAAARDSLCMERVSKIISQVAVSLNDVQGAALLVVEHGESAAPSREGPTQCISHAHIHLVPITKRERPHVAVHARSPVDVDSLLPNMAHEYLAIAVAVGDSLEEHETIRIPCGPGSPEVSRRAIAGVAGVPFVPWRAGLRTPSVEENYAKSRMLLEQARPLLQEFERTPLMSRP